MKNNKKDEIEVNPYELDKFSKIPKWLVVFFIKYWAAAAAVFFILIGGSDVGLSFRDNGDPVAEAWMTLQIIVLLGLFLALFMNYIVKSIVLLMNNRRSNTLRYNMINVKGIKSLFISLGYYLVVSYILFYITLFLSKYNLVLNPFGTSEGGGIEPFTYGFCFIIVDSIFLLIKNVIVYFYKKRKYMKLIKEN